MRMSDLFTSAGRALTALVLLTSAACGPDEQPNEVDAGPDTGMVHEPLAMPAEPTLTPSDFTSATACKDCHPKHYTEWSRSRHAYAMKDPVFRGLVAVRQKDLGGREDQFCTQCHSAIGTRGGECVSGFKFEELSPIVLEGVTCEACHKVSKLARAHNSGHELEPAGPMRGGLDKPKASPQHMSVSDGLLGKSSFCGGCHDVLENNGLPLERPYEEWLQSPAAAAGQQCHDCHMARYDGKAAVSGPDRKGLHRHRFVSVDPALDGLPDAERKELLDARDKLLATAASLSLQVTATIPAGSQLDVSVTVRNEISGHRLPTGSSFIRQFWLAVEVTDKGGKALYVTGDLDKDGDLRDRWSKADRYGDHDLVSFSSQLLDDNGDPTLFPWKAAEHVMASIAPEHERTVTLFAPIPAGAKGPLKVRARLRFRPYPPHLLRLLGLNDMAAKLEISDLAKAEQTVTVQ